MTETEILRARQLLEAWDDRDVTDIDLANDLGDDLADFLTALCGISDRIEPPGETVLEGSNTTNMPRSAVQAHHTVGRLVTEWKPAPHITPGTLTIGWISDGFDHALAFLPLKPDQAPGGN